MLECVIFIFVFLVKMSQSIKCFAINFEPRGLLKEFRKTTSEFSAGLPAGYPILYPAILQILFFDNYANPVFCKFYKSCLLRIVQILS